MGDFDQIGKMGDFHSNDDFCTIGEICHFFLKCAILGKIGGFDQNGKMGDFDSNEDFSTIGEMKNFLMKLVKFIFKIHQRGVNSVTIIYLNPEIILK